ncbi:peptide deformylase [Rugosibacter aromaticivorans]|uniref:Peptide deformylase n=1 Tax=Rugosibacter aromaticivorans TaxID=1565605 RepID=A0A0C5JMP2_9PROT|nr:peptide deformylase [Rugosibacter aromaticivorans]AJP48621.1 peptide deformylase [Rugosibacter aromaticivorans]
MIRPVLHMGDPRLLRIAEPVMSFGTQDLALLLRDMRDTMAHQDGAGIAAPQIGVNLRVVIFGGQPSPRYPEASNIPDTVLINPELTPRSNEEEGGWEGCLSVPGLRGIVPRWKYLHYSGYTERGHFFEREVDGFHARVVQHEVDHLDGILYPRRIRDLTRFGFIDALFNGNPSSSD